MMELTILTAVESGERVDAWLAGQLPGMTRSAVQRLLENGSVTLNGAAVKKNYKVAAGDTFVVAAEPVLELPLIPQNIPLDVVFEDEDVIVVNKPRGMVVHPAPGHPAGTLVNALMYHCGDSRSGVGGAKRPTGRARTISRRPDCSSARVWRAVSRTLMIAAGTST